jgi:hypothetical protein
MPDLFLEMRGARGDGAEDGTSPAPLTEAEALTLLQDGEITASKLVPWGSNYTFAVAVEDGDGRATLAIYKPRAGEAPLYDFPDGTLYRREQASYLLSRRLGWRLVPPTVVRDGPNGVGSVQLYVEPEADSKELRHFWSGKHLDVERLVLFDHLANNADRKIGHLLRDTTGKVWGIDHGLTFNRVPKLRTVLWQFVGEPVAPHLTRDLACLLDRADDLRAELRPYLDRSEVDALLARLDRFLERPVYPDLNPRRNIPYGWW